MNTTDQPTPPEFEADDIQPLFFTNAARRRHWRTKLETFKAVQGFGPMLEHVSEETWARHYAANEDAFSAVVAEVEKITD